MAVFRYSDRGVEAIVRRSSLLSLAVGCAAVLVGLALGGFKDLLRNPLALFIEVGVLGALVLFTGWRSIRNAQRIAISTRFELTPDSLVGHSSAASVVIPRSEVTEVRFMRDGIFIRGRNRTSCMRIGCELEDFDAAAKQIEEWSPVPVQRTNASNAILKWTLPLILGNLGILYLALGVFEPMVAVPCCVVEASLLIACVVFVWRSKAIGARTKWVTLAAVPTALSLLYRAYLLLQGR